MSCSPRPHDISGQAYIFALFVIVVLSILGIGLALVATTEAKLADTHVRQTSVELAAESGLEYAAAMLRLQPGYGGGIAPLYLSTDHHRGRNKQVRDILVTISPPVEVRRETRLIPIETGEQIGIEEITYAVRSTARCTRAQIIVALEAQIAVVLGKSSQIREWKQK